MERKIHLSVQNNTDGSDQTEIGDAMIHDLENGDKLVQITFTNPQIIDALGNNTIKGLVPRNVLMRDNLENGGE